METKLDHNNYMVARFHYKNLINELQHAVDHWKGNTAITQSDIDLMQSVYREADKLIKSYQSK